MSTVKSYAKNFISRKYYANKIKSFQKQKAIGKITSLNKKSNWTVVADKEVSPVWVLGMFRSGTSLSSQILEVLGLDFGPDSHLLQPIGKLKHLNPNGFFENYIFAEYSRYFHHKLGGGGDNIPQEQDLQKVKFSEVDIPELFELSLNKFADDRITFANKTESMRLLAEYGVNDYMIKQFKNRPCIKIPMLSHFFPQINQVWPNSFYVVLVRHPISLIKSSKVLSKGSSYELYNDYYRFLLKLPKTTEQVIYFSYDHLLSNPFESIKVLAEKLELEEKLVEKASMLIDQNLVRNLPEGEIENEETKDIYNSMIRLAINV